MVNYADVGGKTPLDLFMARQDFLRHAEDFDTLNALYFASAHDRTIRLTHMGSTVRKLMQEAHAAKHTTLQAFHIHFCGDGLSGKTTLKNAVRARMGLTSWWQRNSPFRNRTVPRIALSDRTIGQLQHRVDLVDGMQWILHDYGGQKEYHINHPRFLSMAGSVFILTVALFDVAANAKFTKETICTRYEYWLRFLNSVARKKSPIITVINHHHTFNRGEVAAVLAAIQSIQREWCKLPENDACTEAWRPTADGRLLLDTHILVFDVHYIDSAERLRIHKIEKSVQQLALTPIELTTLMDIIFRKRLTWPFLLKRGEFHSTYLKECIHEMPEISAAIMARIPSEALRAIRAEAGENGRNPGC